MRVIMAASIDQACRKVNADTMDGISGRHRQRQDTPDLHYMTTAPANRRRQWAAEDRLAPPARTDQRNYREGSRRLGRCEEERGLCGLSGRARDRADQPASHTALASPRRCGGRPAWYTESARDPVTRTGFFVYAGLRGAMPPCRAFCRCNLL
jgi:hypothetical protein